MKLFRFLRNIALGVGEALLGLLAFGLVGALFYGGLHLMGAIVTAAVHTDVPKNSQSQLFFGMIAVEVVILMWLIILGAIKLAGWIGKCWRNA
jgi:hypothetical protein